MKRWSNRPRDLPGVKTLNSQDPERSCGIGFISAHLDRRRGDAGRMSRPRITLNTYTTLGEIDTIDEVMEKIIKRESLPA